MSDFNHFIKSCKQRSVFTHNGTAPDGRYTDFFLISLLVDIGAVIDCVTAVAMFKCCIKKLYQCTAWCVYFFIMMSVDEFKIEIIELFQCTLQQVVQNMYTITHIRTEENRSAFASRFQRVDDCVFFTCCGNDERCFKVFFNQRQQPVRSAKMKNSIRAR